MEGSNVTASVLEVSGYCAPKSFQICSQITVFGVYKAFTLVLGPLVSYSGFKFLRAHRISMCKTFDVHVLTFLEGSAKRLMPKP